MKVKVKLTWKTLIKNIKQLFNVTSVVKKARDMQKSKEDLVETQ